MSDKHSSDDKSRQAPPAKADPKADAKADTKTEAAPPAKVSAFDAETIYNVANISDTVQVLGEFGSLYPSEGREMQVIALSGADLQTIEHLINPETFSVEVATGERDEGTGTDEEVPPTEAPVNRDVPYLGGTGTVGSVLDCTMGNWDNVPDSYTYQFKSDGTTDLTGTNNTYTVVEADSGHSITCVVTATNVIGSTDAPPSNAVIVGLTRTGTASATHPPGHQGNKK
jgi:hypothetical protein